MNYSTSCTSGNRNKCCPIYLLNLVVLNPLMAS